MSADSPRIPTSWTAEAVVTRSVDLDAHPDAVWRAVTDRRELASWFAPEVGLDVVPGGAGWCRDDEGTVRHVLVEQVGEVEATDAPGGDRWDGAGDHDGDGDGPVGARRVVLRWWPDGDEDACSRVSLTVVARPGGARLLVREEPAVRPRPTASLGPAPEVRAAVAAAWVWRFDLLRLRLGALVPA